MGQPFSGTLTRSDAARLGINDDRLRNLVSSRARVRVRRNAYRDAAELTALRVEEQHRVAVHAAVAALDIDGIVSHQSAAVLHGLPVWGCPLDVVHLTKPRRSAGRRTSLVHIHTAPISDDERCIVDGVAVTTLARTVFDVACAVRFEAGVALADAALNAEGTTPGALLTQVEHGRGRTGRSTARAVAGFADGRSESVGESRSRVGLHLAGLPAPELQVEIRRSDGSVVSRPDFRWGRLLGEFDGAVKYGRLLRPGETPGDAVTREKRREDELRDLGSDMIRWTWADLDAPERLYPRIRAAIERSARRTT